MNFLLLTLILSFHLVCMNAATAGPLVCAVLDWRERRGDELAGRAGRFLAGWALTLFLLGLLLGLAMAWLAWTPALWRELAALLPARIYWGVWELGFSALLLAIYWAWWKLAPGGAGARAGRTLVALLTATNLMYHFPPFFVVAAMLSAGEAASLGPIDDASFRRLIWQGEVIALTVHFWLASLAVAGMLLAVFGLRRVPSETPAEQQPARMARWGAVAALIPTLLQIPVGLWVTMQLPPLRQNQLLGGDLVATALLATGVLAALVLMHRLAAMTMGDTRRQTILGNTALLLAVIVLMTAALRWSRPGGDASPEASRGAPAALRALVAGAEIQPRCMTAFAANGPAAQRPRLRLPA